MQKAGALAIARVPAIYVFPTVKDGFERVFNIKMANLGSNSIFISFS